MALSVSLPQKSGGLKAENCVKCNERFEMEPPTTLDVEDLCETRSPSPEPKNRTGRDLQGSTPTRYRSTTGLNSALEPIQENGQESPRLCRHGSLMLGSKPRNGFLPSSSPDRRLSITNSFRQSLRPPRDFIRNRLSHRRVRNRLVQKSGYCNISLVNIPKQRRKFFSDIFTTLVDVKWRWCLLVFTMGFLGSWLFFSVIFYLIILSHGDLDHIGDPEWTPCINNVKSWVSVFIFSVVSQHTIGYGFRYPSEQCPEVLFMICVQSMVGVMIQTLMAGVVFAKLARPKKRAETILFSKNAVICMRDGQLVFLFRVGDMRKTQLAEAHIRLQMIKKRITAEGELLPFHQFDMNVGFDIGLDRIFVVWPITIGHVIDETSPLYDMSAEDVQTARFEIIVILEGIVESTGATTQARTSYLASEVLWGHRFDKLVTYQRENGDYRIDFSRFHNTYPIQMPTNSAKELDEMREQGLQPERPYQYERMEEVENMGVTPYSTLHGTQKDIRPSLFEKMVERRLRMAGMQDDAGDSALLDDANQNPQTVRVVEFKRELSQPGAMKDLPGPQTMQEATGLAPAIIVRSPSAASLVSLRSNRSRSPTDPTAQPESRAGKKRSVLREHDIM